MLTSTAPRPTAAITVGPPPPFDPELAAALTVIGSLMPPDGVTLETIPTLRQGMPGMEPPTNEDLARAGAFSVEERSVPVRTGRPRSPH